MNYVDIEKLKTNLSDLLRQGCRLSCDAYGVNGKVVGLGFKPLWANTFDSRIDRIQFDILDRNGVIRPFKLNYITGYEFSEDNNLVEKNEGRPGSSTSSDSDGSRHGYGKGSEDGGHNTDGGCITEIAFTVYSPHRSGSDDETNIIKLLFTSDKHK